jgi:hypothetical protein
MIVLGGDPDTGLWIFSARRTKQHLQRKARDRPSLYRP